MAKIDKLLRDLDNPLKYVPVHSREKYWALPEDRRTKKVWFWPGPWYIQISGLPMDIDSILDGDKKSEFDLFDEELAKTYPIQFYLRECWRKHKPVRWLEIELYSFNRMFRDFYYKWIKRTFKPFNKEIRAQIPTREWKDLRDMIPDVLYAMIIHYVEKDNGAEMTEIDYSKPDEYGEREFLEKRNQERSMILQIYGWAKSGRAYTRKKIEEALDEAHKNRKKGLTYEEQYGEMEKLEKYLVEKDTKYLTWIVENREILWT